ncbi:MAG: hypothetical protein Q7U55_12245 [Deltaproteobacteria bacterium]|nr:hypothetical protein [Deltaproteobacteria bacterium]
MISQRTKTIGSSSFRVGIPCHSQNGQSGKKGSFTIPITLRLSKPVVSVSNWVIGFNLPFDRLRANGI